MAIGLVSSPLMTTRMFSWAMEVITGYIKRSSNPFFYDVVIQNSPGTTFYDTTMPRLYRWDSIQGVIIAACRTYIDALRYIAATQSLDKEATHQVDTNMGYLGLNYDTRKQCSIYQTPWGCNGYITISLEGVVLFVTVLEKKWNKAKYIIAKSLSHFFSSTARPYF